jgi:SAM-dependent methyltransferase
VSRAEDDGYGRVTSRYYDFAYGGHPAVEGDVEFYLSLAREGAGPVLELGCGTGRVLLEIARAGFPCTGIDASRAMLNALSAKPHPPTLRLVCAQMQDFDLGSDRFALIYSAFRAFQHLYTVEDQLACLERVRRHLAPGGIFAFDVFNPRLARMAQLEEPEAEDARFEMEGDTVVRYTAVERDPLTQLMVVRMRYERSREGAVVSNDTVEFRMRWYYRFELEHLLRRAGFESVELYGDFHRAPLEGENGFVILCR